MKEKYDESIKNAINNNDLKSLRASITALKKDGIAINDCMESHNYLEMAYDGNADRLILKTLLNEGVDPYKAIMNEVNSVIYRVMVNNDIDTMKFFLHNGADPNTIGIDDLELSLEYCNDPASDRYWGDQEVESREKPLLCAAIEYMANNKEVKKMITCLLNSPDIDLLRRDQLGDNAFAYAAAFGDTKLMEKLFKMDKNVINTENNNLINAAVNNENYDNLKFLVDRGIDVNAISKDGKRDGLSILIDRHNDIMEFHINSLDREKKDLAKNIEGRTKNDKRYKNLRKMLKLLLSKGANIENCQFSNEYLEESKALVYGFILKDIENYKDNSMERD